MAANTDPTFVLGPHVAGVQFANADGTSKKTLVTPGSNGSRLDGLVICTNDTVAQTVAFYVNDGSTDHYIGAVTVPLGSGYTTVARVDALATLAPPAVGALILPSGYALKCNMVVAVTSSDVTDVVAFAGDF